MNIPHQAIIRKNFHFFLTLLALISCSGVKVLNSDANPGFKLSNYKTFDFYKLEASGDTTSNFPANVELLKKAIAKQFELKGLQQSATDPALLVNIGIMVEEKVQTRETTIRDAPRYIGTRNYSWQSGEVEVGRYKEGTVTLHLVDPVGKKLMWKGAVEGVLPTRNSKLPAMIDEAMTALFNKLQ